MTTQAGDELTQLITTLVRDVPDYPQPGVGFKDITPLLAAGQAFSAVVDAPARPPGQRPAHRLGRATAGRATAGRATAGRATAGRESRACHQAFKSSKYTDGLADVRSASAR